MRTKYQQSNTEDEKTSKADLIIPPRDKAQRLRVTSSYLVQFTSQLKITSLYLFKVKQSGVIKLIYVMESWICILLVVNMNLVLIYLPDKSLQIVLVSSQMIISFPWPYAPKDLKNLKATFTFWSVWRKETTPLKKSNQIITKKRRFFHNLSTQWFFCVCSVFKNLLNSWL